MIELRDLYHCEICENVVEVVQAGAPALVCCGEEMQKLTASTEDTGNEKHVPVVNATENGIAVVVGEVEHPMDDDHYIQFIEVLAPDRVLRAELEPGKPPKAEFAIDLEQVELVREYCNLHGLWATEEA